MKKSDEKSPATQEVSRAVLPTGKSYETYAGIGELVHDVVNAWELEGIEESRIRPMKAWWIIEGCYVQLQLEAVTLCRKLGLKNFQAEEVTTEAFECLRKKIGAKWYDEREELDYYEKRTIGYLFFCMKEYLNSEYRHQTRQEKTSKKMSLEGLLAMEEEDATLEISKLEWLSKLRKAANECLREMSQTNRNVWRGLLKGHSLTAVAEKLGRDISDVSRAKKRSNPQLVNCLARKGHKP